MDNSPEQLPLFDPSIITNDYEAFYRQLFNDPIDHSAIKTLDEMLLELQMEFDNANHKWKDCDA